MFVLTFQAACGGAARPCDVRFHCCSKGRSKGIHWNPRPSKVYLLAQDSIQSFQNWAARALPKSFQRLSRVSLNWVGIFVFELLDRRSGGPEASAAHLIEKQAHQGPAVAFQADVTPKIMITHGFISRRQTRISTRTRAARFKLEVVILLLQVAAVVLLARREGEK